MITDILESKKCSGCMACYNACPKQAIKIEEKNAFLYPVIQKEKCIDCGICKNICPVNNKEEVNQYLKIYNCKNKDDKTRMKSSSGGVFSLIAEYILEQNGVVFGARFNEKLEVIHDYITSRQELEKLRGSKYLQSKIGNTYKKVKEFLINDKKVLFTGTPCQVEGLLAYLGKEYDNLYTQDIICHGVPSPKVWKKYLEYKKEKMGEYPIEVSFRKKDLTGWSNFQMSYKYSNVEENIHHDDEPYMNLFLRNFDLRESCYNCSFKKINRKSDITIADSWGIDEICPEFNDEKGISTILINSLKGKKILENIKEKMEYIETNIKDVIKHNSPLCKSVEYNELREDFFEDLENNDFEYIIKKYLKNNT